MRKQFPEYLRPSEEDFKKLWQEALFVFDANVLLSLYRLPATTQKKLILTLSKIKGRIWIPHQVALEYYRRRMEVIYEQEANYLKIEKVIIDGMEKLGNALKEHSRHPFVNTRMVTSKVTKCQKDILQSLKNWKDKRPDWAKEDSIEKELDKIFKGNVGEAYNSERFKSICAEGIKRFESETPPGYADMSKDKKDKTGLRKYGDLFVWFQIIDHATEVKKPIVFVTDDQKEDWWLRVDGHTIGARHELKKEIWDKAGINFHMYESFKFMEYADKYLKATFGKGMIEEVKQLQQDDSQKIQEVVKSVDGLSDSSYGTLARIVGVASETESVSPSASEALLSKTDPESGANDSENKK